MEKKTGLTRRGFLTVAGATACGALLPGCVSSTENTYMQSAQDMKVANYAPQVASAWIPKKKFKECQGLFQETLEASTDFSWLSKGDSVFIKLALNSMASFPATTDPWSLQCLISILKAKGAGKIIVGDSSGVEHVQWKKNIRRGSSRDCCRKAGLLSVIEQEGAEAVFFEEAGYDSFREEYPQGEHHWKEPIMVTKALDDVDHLIYLCRVSSHVLSDTTSGMKIGVGFLREDSRFTFHSGGQDYYAMHEEINEVPSIASKLRLTVSSGRQVLATFGPDKGPITRPDFGMVLASQDILAHEILAYAWLQYNRMHEASFFDRGVTGGFTKFRSPINKGLVWYAWGGGFSQTPDIPMFQPGDVFAHPSIINHMKRRGGRPERIVWDQVNPVDNQPVVDFIRERITLS